MESGSYEVMVVGLGLAGSVTALSAAEAGARVMVVEKARAGTATRKRRGSLRRIGYAAT